VKESAVKAIRNSLLSILALTAVAATGCGHAPAGVAPAVRAASNGMIQSVTGPHKLGYNFQRYLRLQKASAHPQHFEFRGAAPKAVDNRQFCAPIYDQGQLGSCTAFSMAKGLREYLQRSQNTEQVSLSALWFYYQERVLEGSVGDDSGATMSDGMKVLHEQGAATDVTWPYDISKFDQAPPAEADASAPANKINTVTQLASLNDVKAAIAAGKPVSFGFVVYDSFRKIGKDGKMPDPKSNEGVLGGHAVVAVGYNDKTKYLTVRNSWGDAWGDKGYFYMSYKFATDMDNHILEAFTAD